MLKLERTSRKQLAGNICVSRTRTVGPRNKRKAKKKVWFALENTPTQDRVRRIKKKRKKIMQGINWKRTS